jgi:hypothetical protein
MWCDQNLIKVIIKLKLNLCDLLFMMLMYVIWNWYLGISNVNVYAVRKISCNIDQQNTHWIELTSSLYHNPNKTAFPIIRSSRFSYLIFYLQCVNIACNCTILACILIFISSIYNHFQSIFLSLISNKCIFTNGIMKSWWFAKFAQCFF